jgi:hypothetical protein
VWSQAWRQGPGRLRPADREEIGLGICGGQSFTAIAAGLGKAVATVSREVAADGGREAASPGGQSGTTLQSSAADLTPDIGPSDKPLPGPASAHPKTLISTRP